MNPLPVTGVGVLEAYRNALLSMVVVSLIISGLLLLAFPFVRRYRTQELIDQAVKQRLTSKLLICLMEIISFYDVRRRSSRCAFGKSIYRH